jgi:hypothetical protein
MVNSKTKLWTSSFTTLPNTFQKQGGIGIVRSIFAGYALILFKRDLSGSRPKKNKHSKFTYEILYWRNKSIYKASCLASTCQTPWHSPSSLASRCQLCQQSAKAIFEKNVTQFAQVMSESGKWLASGHYLIYIQIIFLLFSLHSINTNVCNCHFIWNLNFENATKKPYFIIFLSICNVFACAFQIVLVGQLYQN